MQTAFDIDIDDPSFTEEVLDMSQYKGYYTAGSSSSRGESQEADHRLGTRGESQEQDCTEYDDGNRGPSRRYFG